MTDHAGEPGDAVDLDLEERRLCPDGACTGVIGDDGRCRVCGRRDDGGPSDATGDGGTGDEAVGSLEVEGEAGERELCPDGGCVGLIGPDGRCKVCGLSRDAAPA